MCKGFMSVYSQLKCSYYYLPYLGVNMMFEVVEVKLTTGQMTTELGDNPLKVDLPDLCGGPLRGAFS